MKSKIFIPNKIKVGFDIRSDTYTGLLGYVIYHDGKVWRKEKSWENWRKKYVGNKEKEAIVEKHNRYYKDHPEGIVKSFDELPYYAKGNVCDDKRVIPQEFNNQPIEGFVLNKKAGGVENSYSSWNPRLSYCRVYDPRGFEIEITIPNLLYILENTNSIKGKGLEGKFVYGWDGTDLVLIPECAPEYKEMIEFTLLQDKKISKKDLEPGYKYLTKDKAIVTYLGYHDAYSIGYIFYSQSFYICDGKKHWFSGGSSFTARSDFKFLKEKLDFDPDYPFLLDKVEKLETYTNTPPRLILMKATYQQIQDTTPNKNSIVDICIETDKSFYTGYYNKNYPKTGVVLMRRWDTKDDFLAFKKSSKTYRNFSRDEKVITYYTVKIIK